MSSKIMDSIASNEPASGPVEPSEGAAIMKAELRECVSALQSNFDTKLAALVDMVSAMKGLASDQRGSLGGRNQRDFSEDSRPRSPPLGDTAWMPRYRNMEDSSDSDRGPRDDRRSSIMSALHQRPSALSTPTVFKQQPSHDHIGLTHLTVKGTFLFLQEISKYQSQHGIELSAAVLVSDTVKNDIMAKYPSLVSDSDFYKLSNFKLFKYIQKAIRPEDPMAFQSASYLEYLSEF